MLWAHKLESPKTDVIDVSDLNEDERAKLKEQNPDAGFYYSSSGKLFMDPPNAPDTDGFIQKLYMTPITLIVDGIVITIYAALSGGIR
jgi:hypothetical protein